MLHDDRVRKLSFTGSTEVGRVLLREAADRVVNVSMELGGNAPFLVFADADLQAAAASPGPPPAPAAPDDRWAVLRSLLESA